MNRELHDCCFFGHRKIKDTLELRTKLCEINEKLIVDENIDTFCSTARVNLILYATNQLPD